MMKRLFFILFFMATQAFATEAASPSPQTVPPTLPPSPLTSANNPAPSGPSQNDILQKAQELEQAIPLIRQQITDTIQSVTQQEQKINDQIAQLQMQNAQLYDQISRLSQQLNEAHQQLLQENKQEVQNTHKISLMRWAGAVFVISFLLIAFTLIWPNLRRKQQRTDRSILHENIPPKTPEVIEDIEVLESDKEYDFMNSREAVPVKLDLARAYIDMGEYESAREVLNAVLENGNEEQRTEAMELLSSVKNT